MSKCKQLTARLLLPPEQQAIRDRCRHPSGAFVEFPEEDVEQSITKRFEMIAAKYPQRIAIKTESAALSFEALNGSANRLARTLLSELGEGAEPVILLSTQDIRTVICCLAILKAGKILVAIDPGYPSERMRRIVGSCDARSIFTGGEHLSLAMDLASPSRKVINTDLLKGDFSDGNINLPISPDCPAEIRYSSGSTGEPKGIVRSHRRVLHSAMSAINSHRVCPDDRLLVLKNMSFGCRSVLRGLLTGAAVYPFDIKREGLSKLPTLLARESITICAMASTTFRYVVNGLREHPRLTSVRLVQIGAERLTRDDVDSFKRQFSSDCVLLHAFSCGESGNICQYFIDHDTAIVSTVVPVGYVIEGKEVSIVDEHHEDLGVDAIGEIAVRSRYLSSEYWGKPGLTVGKFLPDPTGGDQRIYLTGDIGRLLPDGCLMHLGRKDLEVKIRGNKVTISEIEATLMEHPHVKDAGIAVWQRQSGEAYLAAYVCPIKEQRLTTSELFDFLKDRFPEYMIPSRFLILDELPTVNGKLDRRALPEPDHSRPVMSTPFVAPCGVAESQLAAIWGEVLALENVGIHDNFFELGGHSLAVTRVVSRVIQEFQLELPVKALFDSPTVAEMAKLIKRSDPKTVISTEIERMLSEIESMSEEKARAAFESLKGETS